MKRRIYIYVLILISLCLLTISAGIFYGSIRVATNNNVVTATLIPRYAALLATVQKYGTVSIIVGFHVASLHPSEEEIIYWGKQLLNKLAHYQVTVTSDISFIPAIVMTVDEEALRYLMSLPEVTSISGNEVFLSPLEPMSTRAK